MSNISLKIDSAGRRILLVVAGLVCLVAVFFAFTWLFADSISDNAQDKNVAEFAANLVPQNPQAHYSLAVLLEDSFIPEDIPKSVTEYERAVALSPHDYRLWLALGKTRERNGNAKGAELALQKALEMAPHYSQVQWAYGNILLRQGKNEEAFKQIAKAVAGDPRLANPAVTTAWQIFEGNLEKIKAVVGDSNYTRAAFAVFFAKEKRFEDAVNFWKSIPPGDQKELFQKESEILFDTLVRGKKYRLAMEVHNSVAAENLKKKVGIINNGGFEEQVKVENAKAFEWELGKGKQPLISIDNNEKHGGKNSLVFVFRGSTNKEFKNISQIVAVEGNRQYQLELFYKSDLETVADYSWEVFDPTNNKVIASTDAVSKKTDWTALTASFTTPEESEGVIIRLARSKCSTPLCSTSGKLWFDDFSLK